MAEDQTNLLLVVLIAVISVVGVALATASMTTNRSFQGMMGGGGGGGMMNGNTTAQSVSHPGALEWTVLVLSLVFLGAAVVIYARGRMRPSASSMTPVAAASLPAPGPFTPPAGPAVASVPMTASSAVAGAAASTSPAAEPVPEPALMKLLDQDERTMYLEIRDHGGSMLQRDLVALGIFSKAKVTRVLDRLEAKDLVVREAHGMTNRVRIVNHAK